MPSASTAPSATALPSPSPSLSSPSPATPKLRRILIANRGEIAMRVIHACHDTGRIAIAAYADPDADALFVHAADEAYALGGSDAQSTYLNIAAIVETAHKAHVDAVHPGYGFLAENAEFAQAVIDAGMTWIGPQPATIRALGSKVEARRIATPVRGHRERVSRFGQSDEGQRFAIAGEQDAADRARDVVVVHGLVLVIRVRCARAA